MKIISLTQTCSACPSQWEGMLTDGRHIYIRYRFGTLSVGVADTIESAIFEDTFVEEIGDGLDGFMTEPEMLEHLAKHGIEFHYGS